MKLKILHYTSILVLLLLFSQTIIRAQSPYKLVWSDEFNSGNMPDSTKWSYATGKNGWGNHEWQNYTAGANCYVSEGTLKIVAKLEGAGQKVGDYTSTRIKGRKTFTYGRYEVRAKIPNHKGNGLWPAIWMLGENVKQMGWPLGGEIDIMEYVSHAPDTMYFTIHSTANNHRDGTQVSSGSVYLPSIEEEFHNYGFIWSATQLVFYLDSPDNVKLIFNKPPNPNQENWPFDAPFYFILNMAVGGDWGGVNGVNDSIFPATMEVDYVRVYQ